MNIEDTKKAIAVMEAFCEGEVILNENKTLSGSSPSWNWGHDPDTYAVKPKPRGVWVRRYPNGDFGCVNYPTREAAELARADGDPSWTAEFLPEVVR
jgi:hypothetical protein